MKAIRVLLNAQDRTIDIGAAQRLATEWRAQRARVDALVLPDSLGLPHDVIDPR